MRFDSREHLDAWIKDGTFPAIHAQIARMVLDRAVGVRMLDMCCSYGLLGARIKKAKAFSTNVWGIDGSPKTIEAGIAAGIPIDLCTMRVVPSTYAQVQAFIREKRISVLLARRCFPELLGDLGADDRAKFRDMLIASGITEIAVQGRVPVKNAATDLSDLRAEIALFAPAFRVVTLAGSQCALLRLEGSFR